MRVVVIVAGCAAACASPHPTQNPRPTAASVGGILPILDVGQPGIATLTVTPEPGTALLPAYPHYRLALDPVTGLAFDRRIVATTAIASDHVSFPVTLTAAHRGSYTLSGRIDYAVGAGSACVIRSDRFALQITAR